MQVIKFKVFAVSFSLIMLSTVVLSAASSSRGVHVIKMEELLNDDGTLKPLSDVCGSVDVNGYVMVLDENGVPRFQPVKDKPAKDNSGSSWLMGDESWSDKFGVPGVDNYVHALAVKGTDLYVGGRLQVASNMDASYIAKWDGSSWSTLGDGVNGYVYTIVPGPADTVYIGGTFTRAYHPSLPYVQVNRVAMWDGSSWNAFDSGANGTVYALAVDADTLYMGGSFSTPYADFAKWNGSSWEDMGGSLNAAVYTILLDGSDIYIGGAFTSPAKRVAKYTGGSWTASGDINNGIVRTLVLDGSNLYAGGSFTDPANRVALLSAGTWSTVGTGANNDVNALLVSGSELYAVGAFTSIGGNSANYFAKWNGSSWSEVGNGTNSAVYAMAEGSSIFIGGAFVSAGDVGASYVAEWDGSWSALVTSNDYGMNTTVNAMAVNGSYVYVGGSFITAGDIVVNHIARWDGSNWEALGTGVDGTVYDITAYGSNVYVGGNFSNAGGVGVNNIAVWNGANWSSLGGSFDDVIKCVAISDSGIYVGGKFTVPGKRIARYHDGGWEALGSGIGDDLLNYVQTIAIKDYTLYVGGFFTLAGGVSAKSLAYWDGSSWSELGNGVTRYVDPPGVRAESVVNSLKFLADTLYVGGLFSHVGNSGTDSLEANNIAKWNEGTGWSQITDGIENGVNDQVHDMAVSGNYLYAVGDFDCAGSIDAWYAAKFDGSSWTAFGDWTDDFIYAIALGMGDMFVGGEFTVAGNKNAFHFSSYEGESPTIFAEGKVFLEGPYNSGSMTTDLYSAGYIPLTSPYSEDSRTVGSIPADATDWILIQLRTTASGTEIISKSIFVRNDGYLMDEYGNTQITLAVPEGNYYIVIKHRNHLGVMSADVHNFRSGTSTVYDFTKKANSYYGDEAADLGSNVHGMFKGDANANGYVNAADYFVVKNYSGYNGYYSGDGNLTGIVNAADYFVIKTNSGKTTKIP